MILFTGPSGIGKTAFLNQHGIEFVSWDALEKDGRPEGITSFHAYFNTHLFADSCNILASKIMSETDYKICECPFYALPFFQHYEHKIVLYTGTNSVIQSALDARYSDLPESDRADLIYSAQSGSDFTKSLADYVLTRENSSSLEVEMNADFEEFMKTWPARNDSLL